MYVPGMNLDTLTSEYLDKLRQDLGTPVVIATYCAVRGNYLRSLESALATKFPEVSQELEQLCQRAKSQIPTDLQW